MALIVSLGEFKIVTVWTNPKPRVQVTLIQDAKNVKGCIAIPAKKVNK